MEFEPREIDPPNDGNICTKKLAKSKGVPLFCKCKRCLQEQTTKEQVPNGIKFFIGLKWALIFSIPIWVVIGCVLWALFNN